jgi:hypothetical protein
LHQVYGKRGIVSLKISDKELMDAYAAALKLALDHDFIQLLEEEIDNRNLRHLVENYSIEQ